MVQEQQTPQRSVEFFRAILLATAILMYLLMVAGNLVRVNDASTACPDWPTCLGQGLVVDPLRPPADLPAQINYAHRALAGLAAGLSVLGLVLSHRYRTPRLIQFALLGQVILMIAGAGIGAGWTFLEGEPAWLPIIHLGTALAALLLAVLSVMGAFSWTGMPGKSLRLAYRSPFARLSLMSLAGLALILLTGALAANTSRPPDCVSGPFCSGILPASREGWIQLGHNAVTGLESLAMGVLMVKAWRSQRSQRLILPAATFTGVLFVGQAMVGWLKVERGFPLDLIGLHAATAAAVWAAHIVWTAGAGLAGRTAEEEALESAQPVDSAQRRRDLLALTKPVIVVLLLVTTYAGMVVGGKQIPSAGLTFWTLLAGALAAGGSGAVNQYIDRDLDQRMQRTAKRPIPSGRMTPAEGLAFGVSLLGTSFFLMAGFVNLLAALLSLSGMVYYILIYSILLKKATVQNIVIGGGAGAIPPLVGWAAATNSLSIPALFLFAIIFFWTPPHFWALALVRQKDYARAGVPMLPVVRGDRATRVQIFVYTLELVGLTLLMPVFKLTGSLYLVSAVVLGGALILSAWQVLRKGGNKTAWMMYRYSSMYLALLFAALVIDVLIG